MSSFTNRINEKSDYLSQKGNLKHVSYAMFRTWRALKPVTFRLPVTTIDKINFLEEECPNVWESKQEMLFEMIESCIQDWIAQQPAPKDAAAEFDHVARRALPVWAGPGFTGPTCDRNLIKSILGQFYGPSANPA